MPGQIIDGRAIAERILGRIRSEIENHAKDGLRPPGLCTILVGDNPASQIYVRNKNRQAQSVGMASFHQNLPATIDERDLIKVIDDANRDPRIDGILVQLPVPDHVDSLAVACAVDWQKDVDGFHPYNAGMLMLGEPLFSPCTPKGCLRLLQELGVQIRGQRAVVVGRSRIVGRPMAQMLLRNDATVTICHRYTKNLADFTREADIVVCAVGAPHLLGAEHIKDGAVVIDVGITKLGDKIVGDVDTQAVLHNVKAITPVPGGVGPMTIAMLLENTLIAYKHHLGLETK